MDDTENDDHSLSTAPTSEQSELSDDQIWSWGQSSQELSLLLQQGLSGITGREEDIHNLSNRSSSDDLLSDVRTVEQVQAFWRAHETETHPATRVLRDVDTNVLSSQGRTESVDELRDASMVQSRALKKTVIFRTANAVVMTVMIYGFWGNHAATNWSIRGLWGGLPVMKGFHGGSMSHQTE
ncbi:hypothetical protein LTR66_006439 [Elasticomyces elasticus]|nr:hypothetical protein LTR66_006439 [Elasticomyces elasticus]